MGARNRRDDEKRKNVWRNLAKDWMKPQRVLGVLGFLFISYRLMKSPERIPNTGNFQKGDDIESNASPIQRLLGLDSRKKEKHVITFENLKNRIGSYKKALDKETLHSGGGSGGGNISTNSSNSKPIGVTAASPSISTPPPPPPSPALPIIQKGKVFVLQFNGDILCSQVRHLREEVTAITTNADPARGDEVVILLNSGGGTVTGYGLASAQLERIKKANIPLTVCIDQLAASGNLLMCMCCVCMYGCMYVYQSVICLSVYPLCS